MPQRTRLIFVAMSVIGFGVPIAFAVVPSARAPRLSGYLVVVAADIPIALRRARRKRR
jgi:hypothetical protein